MTGKFYTKSLNQVKPNIFFAIIFFILCFFLVAEGNSAEIVDRIVAVVNDDIIALFELNQSIKPYADRIKASGYSTEQEQRMLSKVHQDILKQLVEKKLTDQEIKRYNITVSEKEIDNAIERIKKAGGHTDEDFEEALSREGLTLEAYQGHMKEQILRTKLVNLEIKSKIVITQDDIKSYYQSHADTYGEKKKYHLRNILMRVPPLAGDDEKNAVFKRMEVVLKKLEEGTSFKELAKAYSQSSLAADGGDLGLFSINELSPNLQKAVKGLAAGQHTGILDTDQGYQIFFVQKILSIPGKTIEEATQEIEEKLYREIVDTKFQAWLEDLRKQSHIKIIEQ